MNKDSIFAPMNVQLKINSVNNLTDARYFAAVGATWMGFNFNPLSERSIPVETAKEIMDWLVGPQFLGEFDNQPIEQINAIVQKLGLKAIQTDLNLNIDELDNQVQHIIKSIHISPSTSINDLEYLLEGQARWTSQFLLDFTTHTFAWQQVQKHPQINPDFLTDLCQAYPVLLQLDFDTDNLTNILKTIRPQSIVLQGGNEIATGLQAFEAVDELLEIWEEFE